MEKNYFLPHASWLSRWRLFLPPNKNAGATTLLKRQLDEDDQDRNVVPRNLKCLTDYEEEPLSVAKEPNKQHRTHLIKQTEGCILKLLTELPWYLDDRLNNLCQAYAQCLSLITKLIHFEKEFKFFITLKK